MNSFQRFLVFAGVLVIAVGGIGCSAHYTRIEDDTIIDPRTDGNYRVAGYIHNRSWSVLLFKLLPLGTSSPAAAYEDIRDTLVGSEIKHFDLHVEDYTVDSSIYHAHYGGLIPLVVGTRCSYMTGTIVDSDPVTEEEAIFPEVLSHENN